MQTNISPYEPPAILPAAPLPEPDLSTSVVLRLVTALVLSLLAFWWFASNPLAALCSPLSSFSTAVMITIMLGLMPGENGKFDGAFAIWILFLSVCFSLFIWRLYSPAIAPLERMAAFLLCIMVFGLFFGAVLAGEYMVVRIISRRVARRRTCHALNRAVAEIESIE
jgi:hypothetical protein